jgi:tetratricopeptide (TPR) repeat protein
MWIRTINHFQKKGYGTIVAAATTEYCLSLGSQMRWTTDDYNIGSIKIAEKIGHSLKKKSKVYFLYSDNFINCLENFTRHKYVTKNYMNAISFLNKMFNLRDQTNNKYLWCTNNKYSNAGYNSFSYLLYYYELSQLYELKRDPANAIKYIDKAIYLGRNDPEQLEHVINKNR